MRRSFVVLVLMSILVASVPTPHAQTADGEAVLKAREAALLTRNVESVLQLFAENALVVTSSGRIFIGRDQIRAWVQDQVDRNQREQAGPRYRQGIKLSWPGKVYRDDWEKMGISPLDVTPGRHFARR
jgi:hypothetical protein